MGHREVKLVYLEGDDVRAIRGELLGSDDTFICIGRHGGDVHVAKRFVIKIEEGGHVPG